MVLGGRMETSNIIYLRRVEEHRARRRAKAERRKSTEIVPSNGLDRSLFEFYRQEAET